jgi:hypothetical protein
LTFNEFIEILPTNKLVEQKLLEEENGDFLEELSYIENYYTDNAVLDFFILNAIKEGDIEICQKVKTKGDNAVDLCRVLYNNQFKKETFVSSYVDF